MELGLALVLLITCLTMSAYFSALEMALTSLSVARVRKLIDDKPFFAQGFHLWINKPNLVLVTILIGNNITNTLAAATAAVLAQSYFQNYAISIATFLMTLLILIFGEITPKTFARHNAEKIAPVGMLFLLPIYGVLLPVTLVMSYLSSRIVTLAGGRLETSATVEDIAYMIRVGNEEGILKRSEGHLLQSVIEFRETVAKESMVPRTEISSLEVSATYEEVLSRVIEEGHTRWPVYENNIDNIIGIFHAKDLLRHMVQQNAPFALRDFLRPAKFVPDMMKIGSLLKEFQGGKAHLAIVVDEYGGTAGIISLEDVLEEIVGEIRDEYDDEERERTIHQVDTQNYLVSGKAHISELGKVLDVEFPESDAYDSLGGLLIALYGRMPSVGVKITYKDCTFIVKSADEKKVTSVHVHQERRRPRLLSNNNDSIIEERAAA